jgi:hypothetical protein
MNTLWLGHKIWIECTDDNPSMYRTFVVRLYKMLPVECQQNTVVRSPKR